MDYDELCSLLFKPLKIASILIDDGLGGVSEYAEAISWHDRHTKAACLRICRIETIAEVGDALYTIFSFLLSHRSTPRRYLNTFSLISKIFKTLTGAPYVAGCTMTSTLVSVSLLLSLILSLASNPSSAIGQALMFYRRTLSTPTQSSSSIKHIATLARLGLLSKS